MAVFEIFGGIYVVIKCPYLKAIPEISVSTNQFVKLGFIEFFLSRGKSFPKGNAKIWGHSLRTNAA